mmetsp:Transcript_48768/g.87842  ORF Transcript_48768/g.87842 Transcript_48768/m.87842 type:complete len:92 (-) Transcript_48768:189-464(-)
MALKQAGILGSIIMLLAVVPLLQGCESGKTSCANYNKNDCCPGGITSQDTCRTACEKGEGIEGWGYADRAKQCDCSGDGGQSSTKTICGPA